MLCAQSNLDLIDLGAKEVFFPNEQSGRNLHQDTARKKRKIAGLDANAGFFAHLANRSSRRALSRFDAASNGLPESGPIVICTCRSKAWVSLVSQHSMLFLMRCIVASQSF